MPPSEEVEPPAATRPQAWPDKGTDSTNQEGCPQERGDEACISLLWAMATSGYVRSPDTPPSGYCPPSHPEKGQSSAWYFHTTFQTQHPDNKSSDKWENCRHCRWKSPTRTAAQSHTEERGTGESASLTGTGGKNKGPCRFGNKPKKKKTASEKLHKPNLRTAQTDEAA